MASKRIQGITIEIGGDTTKLAASLKGVDSSISATKRALSDVDKLLKLNPSNTELLAQKQKFLGEAVTQTKERLKQLKEASEQAAKTKDNYDAWKAKITPVWQEIEKTSKHLEELKKKQSEMEGAGDVDSDAYNALQKEIEETSEHLKKLKADAKAVTEEFGHPISPEKYDALQREIIQTENDLKGLEDQSGETGDAEKQLADESQEAGKGLQFLGDAAKAISATLAAAFAASTAAVVAFSKSAVDVGSAFDKSMSQVAATMGKTTSEISNLRDFAQEMGAKTAFSATQAADALNFMALAGYDAETSMQMLPNVLNLAAAGGMELAAASDMVTDSQTALGLSIGETSELVDMMAKASSKANQSVSEFGAGILTVGGTAKNLKGGTVELNAVLGALADNSIKASEGGTHLRNIILAMTPNTEAAANAFKELGVETYENGKLRALPDIFQDIARAMEGMTEQQKTAYKTAIFNTTDLAAADALLSTSKERWDELADSIEHSKYAAELMADTQLDNLAGDVTLFKSALEGAQIVVSDGLMPQLRDFVQFGTEGITRVTDAFKQSNEAISLAEGFRNAEGEMRPLEEIAKELTARFGETAAVASTISFRDAEGSLKDVGAFADELAGKLSAMSYEEQFSVAKFFGLDGGNAVDDLWEILDPVNKLDWKLKKMMEAAEAAASGDMNVLQSMFPNADAEEILSWFDGSEEGLAKFQSAIETVDASNIPDGFSAAMNELPGLIEDGVGMIIDAAPQFLETGATVLKAVASGIANNLPAIGEAASGALSFIVDGILTGLPALTDSAVNAMTSFGESIRENLPGLMKSGLEIAVKLSESIRDNAGKLLDGAISLALSLAKGLADSIPTIVENVPTIVTNIAGVINDNAPKILKAGVDIIITLVKGLIQAIPTIIANIPKIIQAIVAVFTAFNWLNLGKNIMTAIKNGIANMKTAITGVMKNISESAANFFKSAGDFHGLGKAVMNLLKSGIDALKDKIPQALHDIAQSAKSKFTNIDWKQIGKDILTGLWNGIGSMKEWLLGKVGGVVDSLMSRFTGKQGFDEHSPSKWAQRVGEYVSIGLANGIEEKATEAEQAAEKMASNVYNGLSKWAERTTKYEALSLAEQLEMWREIQRQFGENSEEWWSARDKVSDLESKLASEQAQAIKDTYNNLIQSVEYATKRYNWSTRTQLSQYEEIRDRFERNSEEWLAADEKVFDTRQKLLGEQQSAWKSYAANLKGVVDTVSGLESDYQKELAKRAGEIANSYKLFAEVPAAETISGKDLIKNLRAQIDGIRGFYDNLEELSKRGVGDALVDEIRSMGVGAADELEALLKLSDRRLTEYANLYGEKQELSNNIAVRELSDFREETDAKIRENLDSIESLYDEYAPVIGRSLPEGLAEGIRNGMQEALDAAEELANALQAKFDNMGGGSGLQNLLDAASGNAQILAVEPASQRRQNSAVREESYGYDNRAANAGLRSAPIEFNVYNEVGGRRVARLQQRYTDAESARRGTSFLRT